MSSAWNGFFIELSETRTAAPSADGAAVGVGTGCQITGESSYLNIPEAGDIVWLHFNPQAGHEQTCHRPALVLSPSIYNEKTGLMLCCPMTTKIKGKHPVAVLADQVKSLD